VVFALYGVRLVQLQGLSGSAYAAEATSARTIEIPLPSVRGSILDTNGVPLATTVDAVTVVADPTQVDNPAAAALELAGPLQADPAALQEQLTAAKPYVRLAHGVDAPVYAQIRSLGIDGVYSEPAAERAYPSGAVASNVLGVLGQSGAERDETVSGAAGIELAFEDVLAGTPGSLTYERDSAGRMIPLGERQRVEPVPGRDVRLTIDRDIQWYTEQVLAAKVAESGSQWGQAVVMDPRTGAILAMASAPVVDPAKVHERPEPELWDLALEESYEPGSVQKVLTMAALIDAGVARADEVFTVPDEITRADRVIGDFSSHPPWKITLAGILAQSSNVGTLLAAERLDKQTLRDYLLKFGLGRPIGLGFGDAEPAGVVPETWSDLQRDTISFGQGVSTTVLHLASAYAAIANGGVREHPYVVAGVVDPDGTERPVAQAEPVRVVSEQTAAEVTRMMEAVMGPDGTGKNVKVDGYRLAGKSGTAERVDPECSCYRGYTATFAGFAPADDPALVVVVSLQNPVNGRYGTQLGGPVFSDILAFALPRLGIPPSGEPAPDVRVFADGSQ
jgi:cell division protein FtsI (penicillin-binding protein 3)